MRWIDRLGVNWLLIGLLILPLAACQGPAWEDDPQVKAARIACAGLRKKEHYDCVAERAIAGLNPQVCRLVAAGQDEFCLRSLYEAAGDPAICDQLYLEEVAASCRSWYANITTPPASQERRQPEGEHLRDCAAVTARQRATFQKVLAGQDHTFSVVCRQLGRPDWETGSGLIILIYELDDGAEVWLGYAGLEELQYAWLVEPGGQQMDLLSD